MQKLVIVRINYDAMRETWNGGKAADAPLSELQHYLAISGLKPWCDGEHVARMADLHEQLQPIEYEILRDVPLPERVRARKLLAQDPFATSC